MKLIYELHLHHHWVDYGRPGGTPDDFDVFRGSELVGKFETEEATALQMQRRRKDAPDCVSGNNGELMTNEYEIKAVEAE